MEKKEIKGLEREIKKTKRMWGRATKSASKPNADGNKKKSKIGEAARKFFGSVALLYVLSGVVDTAMPTAEHQITKADLATAGWTIEPDKNAPETVKWYDQLSDEPEPENETPTPKDEPVKKPTEEPAKKTTKAPRAHDPRKGDLLDFFNAEIESAMNTSDLYAGHWAAEDVQFDVQKALDLEVNRDISDADRDEITKSVKAKIQKEQDKVSPEERLRVLDKKFAFELFGIEEPSPEVFEFGTVEEPVFEVVTDTPEPETMDTDDETFDVGDAGAEGSARATALIEHFNDEIDSVNKSSSLFERYFNLDALVADVDAALSLDANAGLDDAQRAEVRATILKSINNAQLAIDQSNTMEK